MKFHCINLYDEVPLHEINPVQKKKKPEYQLSKDFIELKKTSFEEIQND